MRLPHPVLAAFAANGELTVDGQRWDATTSAERAQIADFFARCARRKR